MVLSEPLIVFTSMATTTNTALESEEIAAEIFTCFSFRERRKLSRVCSFWRRAASLSSSWSDIDGTFLESPEALYCLWETSYTDAYSKSLSRYIAANQNAMKTKLQPKPQQTCHIRLPHQSKVSSSHSSQPCPDQTYSDIVYKKTEGHTSDTFSHSSIAASRFLQPQVKTPCHVLSADWYREQREQQARILLAKRQHDLLFSRTPPGTPGFFPFYQMKKLKLAIAGSLEAAKVFSILFFPASASAHTTNVLKRQSDVFELYIDAQKDLIEGPEAAMEGEEDGSDNGRCCCCCCCISPCRKEGRSNDLGEVKSRAEIRCSAAVILPLLESLEIYRTVGPPGSGYTYTDTPLSVLESISKRGDSPAGAVAAAAPVQVPSQEELLRSAFRFQSSSDSSPPAAEARSFSSLFSSIDTISQSSSPFSAEQNKSSLALDETNSSLSESSETSSDFSEDDANKSSTLFSSASPPSSPTSRGGNIIISAAASTASSSTACNSPLSPAKIYAECTRGFPPTALPVAIPSLDVSNNRFLKVSAPTTADTTVAATALAEGAAVEAAGASAQPLTHALPEELHITARISEVGSVKAKEATAAATGEAARSRRQKSISCLNSAYSSISSREGSSSSNHSCGNPGSSNRCFSMDASGVMHNRFLRAHMSRRRKGRTKRPEEVKSNTVNALKLDARSSNGTLPSMLLSASCFMSDSKNSTAPTAAEEPRSIRLSEKLCTRSVAGIGDATAAFTERESERRRSRRLASRCAVSALANAPMKSQPAFHTKFQRNTDEAKQQQPLQHQQEHRNAKQQQEQRQPNGSQQQQRRLQGKKRQQQRQLQEKQLQQKRQSQEPHQQSVMREEQSTQTRPRELTEQRQPRQMQQMLPHERIQHRRLQKPQQQLGVFQRKGSLHNPSNLCETWQKDVFSQQHKRQEHCPHCRKGQQRRRKLQQEAEKIETAHSSGIMYPHLRTLVLEVPLSVTILNSICRFLPALQHLSATKLLPPFFAAPPGFFTLDPTPAYRTAGAGEVCDLALEQLLLMLPQQQLQTFCVKTTFVSRPKFCFYQNYHDSNVNEEVETAAIVGGSHTSWGNQKYAEAENLTCEEEMLAWFELEDRAKKVSAIEVIEAQLKMQQSRDQSEEGSDSEEERIHSLQDNGERVAKVLMRKQQHSLENLWAPDLDISYKCVRKLLEKCKRLQFWHLSGWSALLLSVSGLPDF